ncbi:mannan-binding lectin [Spirulina sp. 06S082]|uniref:mannan-binding lectin n=1 Tax=Spirulina sp. 06S082 TaxID=3110248 RepID=UPI002B1FCE95|nr:mannan-binding lectin [Spirulina sp. 06S082]MEA5470911.1 mannan-binding lectin [Spirulina sp. 06S082]
MNKDAVKKMIAAVMRSVFYGLFVFVAVFAFAANAFATDIQAGPIWDNSDADLKCPVVCGTVGGNWNGNWTTTVWNEMSVCGCENVCGLPPVPGFVSIGLNFDIQVQCPVACEVANGEWTGVTQRVNISPGANFITSCFCAI